MTHQIRILHVFGRMGRGGSEIWLMNVLRRIDRARYHFDFLVHRDRAGEFDEHIRSLGGSIFKAANYRHPVRYPFEFEDAVRRSRCDIVHSHVSHFSGYVLSLARVLGVRGRIAHSHSALPMDGDSALRRIYKYGMRQLIHLDATLGLGCSSQACASLFGKNWVRRRRYRRLPYGYDFGRFAVVTPDTRSATRRQLGLADNAQVIGHVGRFSRPKNHEFIADLAHASKAGGRADQKFVLVGDGELRPRFTRLLAQRGLADKVIMTGLRDDIPELLSCFDVLILPSLWEGLPVAILEAQAVGVPCIISDLVSPEVIVSERSVRRLPLSDIRPWMTSLDEMSSRAVPIDEALSRMRASEFAIEHHVREIEAIYRSQHTG